MMYNETMEEISSLVTAIRVLNAEAQRLAKDAGLELVIQLWDEGVTHEADWQSSDSSC